MVRTDWKLHVMVQNENEAAINMPTVSDAAPVT